MCLFACLMKLFFNFYFGEPNIESERGDYELEPMISKENVTEGDWAIAEFATKQYMKYYPENIATVLCDQDNHDFVGNFLKRKLIINSSGQKKRISRLLM